MKNLLKTLPIMLLKIWAWFLISLVTFESIIITLDLIGYENQANKLANYIHL